MAQEVQLTLVWVSGAIADSSNPKHLASMQKGIETFFKIFMKGIEHDNKDVREQSGKGLFSLTQLEKNQAVSLISSLDAAAMKKVSANIPSELSSILSGRPTISASASSSSEATKEKKSKPSSSSSSASASASSSSASASSSASSTSASSLATKAAPEKKGGKGKDKESSWLVDEPAPMNHDEAATQAAEFVPEEIRKKLGDKNWKERLEGLHFFSFSLHLIVLID